MGNIIETNHIHHFDLNEIKELILRERPADTYNEILKYMKSDNSFLRLPYPEVIFHYKIANKNCRVSSYETLENNNIVLRFYLTLDDGSKVFGVRTFLKMFYPTDSTSNAEDIYFGAGIIFNNGSVEDKPEYYELFFPILYGLVIMSNSNCVIVDEPRATEKRKWNSLNRGKRQIIYKNLILVHKRKRYTMKEAFGLGNSELSLLKTIRSCTKIFKHYFGRGPKKVWVPSHTTGNKETGELVKNYIIKGSKNVRRQKEEYSN